MRRRKRSVQLNNRWGSRRNRILFAISLTLISIASWLLLENTEVKLAQYLVASTNISSSTPIGQANLTSTPMDLGEANNQYLKASEQNLTKWVLVRPVNAGELIPLSSIAPAKLANCTQIVVALAVSMANTVKVGDSIDLWAADQSSSIESIPVEVVSAGELVSAKLANDGFGQSAQSIEVCISPAEIRSVVSAIARKATVVGIRSEN
jgi:flagella basal body P-ring formation protein FlgA